MLARWLGLTANRWERDRSLADVVRLADRLLLAGRWLTLVLVGLALFVGLGFLFGPRDRFTSPSYAVLRDMPGGIRLCGLILAAYGLLVFVLHITRQLVALKALLAAGCGLYLLLAGSYLSAVLAEPRAGMLAPGLFLFVALTHLVGSAFVVPPKGSP